MMKYVLEGLHVDQHQMRENLDRLGGFLLSERVMFVLSQKIGKQTAHELVYQASMRGIESGKSFERALIESPEISKALTENEIRAALNPESYLGHAPAIVDRVLKEQMANGWLED